MVEMLQIILRKKEITLTFRGYTGGYKDWKRHTKAEKREFNLNDVILNVVDDRRKQIENGNENWCMNQGKAWPW